MNRHLPANTGTSSSFRQSGIPALRLVERELEQVKKLIGERLAGRPEELGIGRLLRNFNSCSGKMLRPGLLLLSGSSCGKITDKHIHAAAMVEIIHNATLLHDDVIDEGGKRRGRPTINSLWGNERAVLLGDFLLSRVFEMCANLEPQVVRAIAGAAVRVCEGELRQITQRKNWHLSEPEYISIITEKSAALFSCCCYLGGFLAGANEDQVRLLADFGLNAGIAFQIVDDLLDIAGNESKTGKTVGSDAEKNKPTLAVIHLLRMMGESSRSAVKSKLEATGRTSQALAEMLRSHGSLTYTHTRAEEFVAKAISALADLEESQAKEALIETAKFMGRQPI